MNYECFDFNMLCSCFLGNQTADCQIREAEFNRLCTCKLMYNVGKLSEGKPEHNEE